MKNTKKVNKNKRTTNIKASKSTPNIGKHVSQEIFIPKPSKQERESDNI